MKTFIQLRRRNYLVIVLVSFFVSATLISCEKDDTVLTDVGDTPTMNQYVKTEIINVYPDQWQAIGNNNEQAQLNSNLLMSYDNYQFIKLYVKAGKDDMQKNDALNNNPWVQLPNSKVDFYIKNSAIIAEKSCEYCPSHLVFKVEMRLKEPVSISKNEVSISKK